MNLFFSASSNVPCQFSKKSERSHFRCRLLIQVYYFFRAELIWRLNFSHFGLVYLFYGSGGVYRALYCSLQRNAAMLKAE